jgi:NADP-dependent 3-hydroxy acid dehydrogenase YdfG
LTSPARTALISGAGSGIGRAVANALSAMGLRVALIGRDAAKLEGTRAGLGEAAGSTLVLPCDVADRAAINAAVARTLDEFGSIDVLVCNAGTNTRDRRLDVLDPAEWDRLIATNLTGAFNLVHAALPSMRAAGAGLIVQVASIAGKRASVLGGSAYSASKFGQAALGLCLAREEGPNGIRSSVIYPGEVNTPILDARPVKVEESRKAQILQGEDVAAAVKFLVELHPRAHIPELVIKPTVDDWA